MLAIRVHRSWLNALHRLEPVHNHCTASIFYIYRFSLGLEPLALDEFLTQNIVYL